MPYGDRASSQSGSSGTCAGGTYHGLTYRAIDSARLLADTPVQALLQGTIRLRGNEAIRCEMQQPQGGHESDKCVSDDEV